MNPFSFDSAFFHPGVVRWNKLAIDLDTPHQPQLWSFYDGLVFVEYPNGIRLDVAWHPSLSPPDGAFVVSLNKHPTHWEPFFEKTCTTIPQLRAAVTECVEIARAS